MKKLIPILMILCVLAGLAACGKQEAAPAIITPEPITTQTTEQTEQAAVSVPTVAPVTATETGEQSGDNGEAGQVSRGNDSGTTTTTTTNTSTNTNSGNSNSDPYTVAQGYVGQSLSSLQAAIGSPSSSEYVVSCLEDASQEGLLYYNGFMVWTIQYNDGTEIVKGVSQ